MSAQEQLQRYLQLAHQYEQAGQLRERDRCLELALEIAWQAGKVNEAERLWHRLRKLSPHRYLCTFNTLQEAMQRPEVRAYLANVLSQSVELVDRSPPPSAAGNVQTASSSRVTSGELVLPLDTSLMRDSGAARLDAPPVARQPSPAEPVCSAVSAQVAPCSHVTSSPTHPVSPPSVSPQVQSSQADAFGRPVAPTLPKEIASGESLAETSKTAQRDRLSFWIAGSLAILLVLLALFLLGYIILVPFLPDFLGQ